MLVVDSRQEVEEVAPIGETQKFDVIENDNEVMVGKGVRERRDELRRMISRVEAVAGECFTKGSQGLVLCIVLKAGKITDRGVRWKVREYMPDEKCFSAPCGPAR